MNTKITFIVLFLFAFQLNIDAQSDTINVYYDIGVYKLDKISHKKLSTYLDAKSDSIKYNVTISSSADFLGSRTANFNLSQKRAERIKKILIFSRPNTFSSFTIINKGEISRSEQFNSNKKGELKNRKTSVIFNEINKTIKESNEIINDSTIVKPSINNEYGKLEVGKSFRINDLFFFAGTAKLKGKSNSTLIKLAKFLNENPNLEFDIIGHLCCNADNRTPSTGKSIIKFYDINRLSVKRAKFIYKYLYHKGIKKERMTYYGYQFQLPIYFPEKSVKEMNANKRVEIKITKI